MFTCSGFLAWNVKFVLINMYLFNGKMLVDNSNQKTPTKVIKPDNLCRVRRAVQLYLAEGNATCSAAKNSLKKRLRSDCQWC